MTAAIVTRLGCCFSGRVSAVPHKATGDVDSPTAPMAAWMRGSLSRKFSM
jgi:hypothetical protein